MNGVHRTRRVRGLLAAVCALAGAFAALAVPDEFGFESGETCEWSGPWGGGMSGGAGKGEFVSGGSGEFVRTGKRALRLSVWDSGITNAMSWAFLAQKMQCVPGSRVRAGASFYASSKVMPMHPGAVAQLRIEYYYDDTCESQIPTHVKISEPFSVGAGYVTDQWHGIEVTDRVPPDATCLRFSIVLVAEHPGRKPGAVWVDDTFVDLSQRGGNRANARRESRQEVPRPRSSPYRPASR